MAAVYVMITLATWWHLMLTFNIQTLTLDRTLTLTLLLTLLLTLTLNINAQKFNKHLKVSPFQYVNIL